MATVKQTIGANTGASSRATQYKKSAAVSARVFANAARRGHAGARATLGAAARRRSLGGRGG